MLPLPRKYTNASFTLENFIDKYVNSHPRRHEKTREELIYDATDRFNYIRSNPKKHWEENRQAIIDMDANFYGILSLTHNPGNILMWSHYANFHTGFCLGIDMIMFCSEIAKEFQSSGCKIGPVCYKDEYPEVDFNATALMKSINLCFTKSLCWEYEEEYRFVFPNNANKVIKYPKGVIKELYLGCKMPDNHIDEIIKFLKDENLKIILYKMEMGFDRFVLEPRPLNY